MATQTKTKDKIYKSFEQLISEILPEHAAREDRKAEKSNTKSFGACLADQEIEKVLR